MQRIIWIISGPIVPTFLVYMYIYTYLVEMFKTSRANISFLTGLRHAMAYITIFALVRYILFD